MEAKKKPSKVERGLRNVAKAWKRKQINKLPIPHLLKVFLRSFV